MMIMTISIIITITTITVINKTMIVVTTTVFSE